MQRFLDFLWIFATRSLPNCLGARYSSVVLSLAMRFGRLMTRYRLWIGRPRSLWGVTPILTTTHKARSDRLLGIRGDSLVFTHYYVTQKFDFNLKSLVERLGLQDNVHFFRLILAWALLHYDFFNYFFDRGILPTNLFSYGAELEILRSSGKRIYVYAYGADVRTRKQTLALGQWNCCMDCPEPGKFCVCDETTGPANIAMVARHAHALIAMGDMTEYVPDCRPLDYWPVDLAAIEYVGVSNRPGPLKVAHSPNHPAFKGTRFLETAIVRLREQGVPVELLQVSGVTNDRVLELFAEADIIADQFITGFFGYTALEAMARGKPVLCYLRNPSMIAQPQECPIINTGPDTLLETLQWCAEHREELVTIGLRGRRYVERYHSIEAVAARLGNLYLDTAGLPNGYSRRLRNATEAIEKNLAASFPV